MSTQITPRRSSSQFLPDLFRESSLLSSPWSFAARSPFRDLARMQDRMDRLFSEMMQTFPSESTWSETESRAFTPVCDISREENRYVLSFDLPGVRQEDISLEITEDQLIVSGVRSSEKHEKEEGREMHERTAGSYYRAFALPSEIQKEQITANYENGVLQVILPHTVALSARKIPIAEGLTTHKAVSQKASTKVA